MSNDKCHNDWNPGLYLRYKDERTQPAIDLVSRIRISNPAGIIDIGCGPGNSTRILRDRWPHSKITGLDNSPEMIRRAKDEYPDQEWILSDASDIDSKTRYDIVFSNAAIQWIPDHENLIEKLSGMIDDRGALAVQLPLFGDMPLGRSIERVAGNVRWNRYTRGCGELFTYHDHAFYYDLLSRYSDSIDMWETSYIHEMGSHDAILEWIESTGLKPYLERLDDDEMKMEFKRDVLEEIRTYYPMQRNEKVLFPFVRLFFVAYM